MRSGAREFARDLAGSALVSPLLRSRCEVNVMRAVLGYLVVAGALIAVPLSTHAAGPQAAAAQPSDKTIADRAEAKIHKDPTLKQYDISVSVANGVVMLTGTVTTA